MLKNFTYILKLKIKKIIILILFYSSLFSLEISPFISYTYDSDTDLYLDEKQNLHRNSFGFDIFHSQNNFYLESRLSYHLFTGINKRPNSFNYYPGIGYIENNPGLDSNQFNFFLTSLTFEYSYENIVFFLGLNNQIWGPGVNKIILSDKSPHFFNFGYNWNLSNNFSYTHLYGRLESQIEDSSYSDIYNSDSGRIPTLHRSINAHKINYLLLDQVTISLYEMIVYGGNRSFEPYYFLPLVPFLPIQTYLGDLDNDLIGMSIELKLQNNSLYTSLVIDEWTPPDTFKKEHKNWFIYQFGVDIETNLFNNNGQFALEYIYSDNRVYRHKFSINDYYSYSYPLGFWAGPHSSHLFLFLEQSIGEYDLTIEFSDSKRGESIYGYNNNFSERYLNGYEQKKIYKLALSYNYNNQMFLDFSYSIIDWKNAGFNPLNINIDTKDLVKNNIQVSINYLFKEYKL